MWVPDYNIERKSFVWRRETGMSRLESKIFQKLLQTSGCFV